VTTDRRRHRVRGLLSWLTWPLRQGWTEKDQQAYDWEIAFVRRDRRRSS
jgi:hypothetical protein